MGFDRSQRWTSKYRKFRAKILKRDGYLCQECNRNGHITPGNELDHIVPVHLSPDDFYNEDNCQILCEKCHLEKSRREQIARDSKSEIREKQISHFEWVREQKRAE